jgi:hypothetical protein
MTDFPSYAPSNRSFSPGAYPQKRYRSLSGFVVKRTFGDRPSGAKLDLEFSNITDDKVVDILAHYRQQTARNARFKLGSKVLTGLTSSLTQIASGFLDDLRWEYEAPPQVQSIRSGISSVRVSLLGEIRNMLTDEA